MVSLIENQHWFGYWLNVDWLWPSNDKWCKTFWSPFVQLKACRLSGSSCYLNQSWLTFNKTIWKVFQCNLIWNSHVFIQGYVCMKYRWHRIILINQDLFHVTCIHHYAGIKCINSLWSGCKKISSRSESTLVHVMACFLKAVIHYLMQCWLIIREFLWYL